MQRGLHRFPYSFQLLRGSIKGRRQHRIQDHIFQSFLQQCAKLQSCLHCQCIGKARTALPMQPSSLSQDLAWQPDNFDETEAQLFLLTAQSG